MGGDVYTNGEQLGWQFAGVAITVGYAAVVSAILVRRKCTMMGCIDCLGQGFFLDCLRTRFVDGIF